jgi:hypothetical protein
MSEDGFKRNQYLASLSSANDVSRPETDVEKFTVASISFLDPII